MTKVFSAIFGLIGYGVTFLIRHDECSMRPAMRLSIKFFSKGHKDELISKCLNSWVFVEELTIPSILLSTLSF